MLEFLDGATRLHLIIGDPVAQTKSPAGLTREFAARKVNAICVPLHVAPADFDAVMTAAKRVRNIDGIIVTPDQTIIDRVLERLQAKGVDSVNLPYQKFPRNPDL